MRFETPPLLRFNACQLRVAGGSPPLERHIRQAPRCITAPSIGPLLVSPPQPDLLGCGKFAACPRWSWSQERRSDSQGSFLVQLGGLHTNDPRPALGSVHARASTALRLGNEDEPGCSHRRAASPLPLPWWNRSHSAARGAGPTVKHHRGLICLTMTRGGWFCV